MKSAFIAAFVMCAVLHTPAEARKYHHPDQNIAGCQVTDVRMVCGGTSPSASSQRIVAQTSRATLYVDEGTVIGSRPEGCPHAYCGCGLRKYLGLDDNRLNLASNWARFFPRVSGPSAGVAAVRGGHVMYLESSAGDGQWLVRDYNSGGGLSRLHVRDVRGYIFVNPRGSRST